MKNQAVLALVIAAVTSALIWASSPWLTGQREPWDAEFPFYVVALLVAGAVAGGLTPKPLWAHYVGSVMGQLSYEAIFLKMGPLFVLGVGFLLGYSLVFVAAASLTSFIRLRFNNAP